MKDTTIARKLTQPRNTRIHGRKIRTIIKLRPKRNSKFHKYISLDHTVEKEFDGQYVVEHAAEVPNYNLRLLNEFCIREGKRPENLTVAELKKIVKTTR